MAGSRSSNFKALAPYYGEFLISPVPLELQGNYCSHKCAYCFANLDAPQRRMDVRQAMGLIANHASRRTLEARLLQLGYPVCASNHVDPFSVSNWRLMRPVLEALVQLGNGVQIQTRGAPEHKDEWIAEALAILPPAVWYVTIPYLDEARRQALEPGAPSIASRFALIDRVRAAGHRVVVGFNPAVPEWEPHPEQLLAAARDHGAEGVWIERLHLNRQQEAEMSAREREAMGEPLLTTAKKRRADPAHFDYVIAARHAALDLGLQVFGIGQPCRSDFFRPYQEIYGGRVFPTQQDWVNYCYDTDAQGRLIEFDEFADFYLGRTLAFREDGAEGEEAGDDVHHPYFPRGTWPIDNYLGAVGHNVFRDRKIPPQMTFRQLLAIVWSELRFKICPARVGCFAFAALWDEAAPAGWVQLVDERRLPYLLFSPDGFDDYYAQAPGVDLSMVADGVTPQEVE